MKRQRSPMPIPNYSRENQCEASRDIHTAAIAQFLPFTDDFIPPVIKKRYFRRIFNEEEMAK